MGIAIIPIQHANNLTLLQAENSIKIVLGVSYVSIRSCLHSYSNNSFLVTWVLCYALKHCCTTVCNSARVGTNTFTGIVLIDKTQY